MNHGSLFSGIGGFDLAAQWMGWTNVFHCEWNPFGKRVLKYYWPDAISYDDICKTDFTIHRGSIDILTGGFPCQPYSVAGKRKGTEDSRHLWPEMLRAIRECRPTWIVGENVPGIINWSKGLVFEQVCAELEGEGYEVQPVILPACSTNAPHKRERIWIVANSIDSRYRIVKEQKGKKNGLQKQHRETIHSGLFNGTDNEFAANYNHKRLERRKDNREVGTERTESHKQLAGLLRPNWQDFPTVAPICSRDDGVSYELDNITFSKWRNESIKAYGNAIVPQVAYQIFKVIEEMNNGPQVFTGTKNIPAVT